VLQASPHTSEHSRSHNILSALKVKTHLMTTC